MKQRLRDALADFWEVHNAKLITLLLTLAAALVGAVTNQEVRDPLKVPVEVLKEVIKEVPVVTDPNDPFSYPDGWVDDKPAVQAMIAQFGPPVFGETPAGSVQDMPKAVYSWKLYEKLPIRGPPIKSQGGVGSCVSFGTNRAAENSLAAEIVTGNRPYEWARFAEEVTYGLSRVEIGGGRIRGDGSVGAWAAQALVKYGLVPRGKYGNTDLSVYNESRCRQYGASGVPSDIEAVAKKFVVASTAQITNWGDGKKAIANGYSIAICSNVGFNNRNGTVGTRDSRGVIMPNGTWNHCMCADGYHTDVDGTEYVHITNSWGGNTHGGPVGWGDPPTDGFWTPASVVERMLRQGDSWTFSGIAGFPRRTLPDGFILNEPVWQNGRNPSALVLNRPRALQDVDVLLAW